MIDEEREWQTRETCAMVETGPVSGAARFDVRTTSDSHFSWLRTRMSLERTLMSWVRTGIALVGFGFTIFQFFGRLKTTPGVAAAAYPRAPQYLALGLIGAGTIGLIIAAWEYNMVIRYLWSTEFKPIAGISGTWHTPIFAVTILLILIGLFAFGAVLFRVP
jgi:inner membrane protein YidH